MQPLPPADVLRDQFLTHGYVLLEDVLDPALLAACDTAMYAHFAGHLDQAHADNFRAAQTDVVPWGPAEAGVEPFVRLTADPVLDAATRAVLGGPYAIQGSLVMYSPPHSVGQAWHQDCPCADANRFNLNRLIYTRDIGAHGGQVVIVPGSHRQGELPAGEPHGDLPGQLVLAPKAGTLLFLHGHCYHKVLPVTSQPRISVNLRALPQGTPANITDLGVYRNLVYRFSTREVVRQRV